MGKPAGRVATCEDLFGLPDNVVGEIFGGELVTHPHPHPGPKHALAASAVGALLFNLFDHKRAEGSEGWWILNNNAG